MSPCYEVVGATCQGSHSLVPMWRVLTLLVGSARAAVSVHGVPGGVHLQALLGNTHAHAHRRAALRVRCLLQTLHAEIHPQHSQAHSYRYGKRVLYCKPRVAIYMGFPFLDVFIFKERRRQSLKVLYVATLSKTYYKLSVRLQYRSRFLFKIKDLK